VALDKRVAENCSIPVQIEKRVSHHLVGAALPVFMLWFGRMFNHQCRVRIGSDLPAATAPRAALDQPDGEALRT
jgi:hypothetical protein